MRRLVLLAALALVPGACASSSAPPEAPAVAASPRPDPSIRTLDDAIVRYKMERYAEAAWGFGEVAAGRLAGDPQVAALWLGKAYYRLDDHRRAATIFAAIAGEPEHPAYLLALPWLVQLRSIHPDDRQLLQAVGRYDLSVLEHPDLSGSAGELRVAFAAHRLSIGDVQAAYALAAEVAVDEPARAESQLIAGLAAERLGRRQEAIARLREAATEPPQPSRRARRRGPAPSPREAARAEIRARARRELEVRGVHVEP